MKRINALQVLNLENEGADHGEWIQKLVGHMGWVSAAREAIDALTQTRADVVIIDGFSLKDAEMIALEIKMQIADPYIVIIDGLIKHHERSEYADEVIPSSLQQLREALARGFSEAI